MREAALAREIKRMRARKRRRDRSTLPLPPPARRLRRLRRGRETSETTPPPLARSSQIRLVEIFRNLLRPGEPAMAAGGPDGGVGRIEAGIGEIADGDRDFVGGAFAVAIDAAAADRAEEIVDP